MGINAGVATQMVGAWDVSGPPPGTSPMLDAAITWWMDGAAVSSPVPGTVITCQVVGTSSPMPGQPICLEGEVLECRGQRTDGFGCRVQLCMEWMTSSSSTGMSGFHVTPHAASGKGELGDVVTTGPRMVAAGPWLRLTLASSSAGDGYSGKVQRVYSCACKRHAAGGG